MLKLHKPANHALIFKNTKNIDYDYPLMQYKLFFFYILARIWHLLDNK